MEITMNSSEVELRMLQFRFFPPDVLYPLEPRDFDGRVNLQSQRALVSATQMSLFCPHPTGSQGE